jgi:hypothetical protein
MVIAHELAHVVQQRRGGPGPAESAGLEADADQAAASAALGMSAEVSGTAGPGVARQAKRDGPSAVPVAVVKLYEFVDEDGKKQQVTESEMAALRKQAEQRVRSKLRRAKDMAENHRSTHEWFMKDVHGEAESLGDVFRNPKALIGIAVDMRSGVVPPYIGMWSHPIRWAEEGEKALAEGDLAKAARLLRMADSGYRDAVKEWNAYMDAIQEGGQKLIGELEIVRDVSFAIAITAAVVVAAPMVAGAAAAAGATGATATAVTAVGTGLVGAGTGAGLRATGEAAGQKVAYGKVDTKKVRAEAWRGAKEGFVTGVTAGTAHGLGSALGVGAQGTTFTQQVVRRGLAEGGANAVGQITQATLEGKSVGEIAKSGVVGFGTGTLTAPLGAVSSRLSSAGRPMASKAVEVGGSALVAGGATLLGGGTWEEARKNALIAATSSGTLAGAKLPPWAQKIAAMKPPPKGGGGGKTPEVETPPVKTTTAETGTETGKPPATTEDVTPPPTAETGTPAVTTPKTTDPAHGPPAAETGAADLPKATTSKGAASGAGDQPGTDVAAKPAADVAPDQQTTPLKPPAAPDVTPSNVKPQEPAGPAAVKDRPPAPKPQADGAGGPTGTPVEAEAPLAPPPKAKRVAAQEDVVKRKQAKVDAAQARGDKASADVTKAEGEIAAGKKLVAELEVQAKQARAAADQARTAREQAPPGEKRAAIRASADARKQAEAAESALAKAQNALKKAQGDLDRANAAQTREKGQPEKRREALKTSEEHLKRVEKQAEGPQDEAPRLQPGEPFDPKKRRPNLSDFKDVPAGPVDRHEGVRTDPQARVGVFKEKVSPAQRAKHDELVQRIKEDPSKAAEAGHEYERELAKDITPGDAEALRLRSEAGDKPRISDHGTHEFTVEGELSDGKLDQIWRDLLTVSPGASGPRDLAIVTVPRLSDKSAERLAHMAAVYEKLTGRRPMITVRETAP